MGLLPLCTHDMHVNKHIVCTYMLTYTKCAPTHADLLCTRAHTHTHTHTLTHSHTQAEAAEGEAVDNMDTLPGGLGGLCSTPACMQGLLPCSTPGTLGMPGNSGGCYGSLHGALQGCGLDMGGVHALHGEEQGVLVPSL